MASTLQHGSHDHPLQHMGTMDASVGAANCGACDLPFTSGNDLFGCRRCSFFLHSSCTLMPASFPAHPAHQQHPLRLLYAPAYSGGFYGCDICGNRGQRFNYHCQTCQFNVHVRCVNLPPKAQSPAHQHRLQLLFSPPAMGRTSCGVCGLQIQYCCYSCSRCSFFLHPQCLNRQPDTGCSNKQEGPQQGSNNQRGPTKHNRQNLGTVIMGALVSGVAQGVVRSIFDGIGIGDWLGDGAGEDNDVQDGDGVDDDDNDDDDNNDDFGDDMNTFGQPPGFGGSVDSASHAEDSSLAFEHMARMGDGA